MVRNREAARLPVVLDEIHAEVANLQNPPVDSTQNRVMYSTNPRDVRSTGPLFEKSKYRPHISGPLEIPWHVPAEVLSVPGIRQLRLDPSSIHVKDQTRLIVAPRLEAPPFIIEEPSYETIAAGVKRRALAGEVISDTQIVEACLLRVARGNNSAEMDFVDDELAIQVIAALRAAIKSVPEEF